MAIILFHLQFYLGKYYNRTICKNIFYKKKSLEVDFVTLSKTKNKLVDKK